MEGLTALRMRPVVRPPVEFTSVVLFLMLVPIVPSSHTFCVLLMTADLRTVVKGDEIWSKVNKMPVQMYANLVSCLNCSVLIGRSCEI